MRWRPTPCSASAADGGEPDLRLSLETGRLITATHSYRDVAMQLRLKAGNLELPLLRPADEGGLLIDLKGAPGKRCHPSQGQPVGHGRGRQRR